MNSMAQAEQNMEKHRIPDHTREVQLTTSDYVNDSRNYSYQSNINYISRKNSYESVF